MKLEIQRISNTDLDRSLFVLYSAGMEKGKNWQVPLDKWVMREKTPNNYRAGEPPILKQIARGK